MIKYKMLGVNGNGTKCCILNCLLPYSKLDFEHLEVSDFKHDSTNWCGCDDISRTIQLEQFELTGNSVKLKEPLVFRGVDYDMGHEYPWTFTVREICEIKLCPLCDTGALDTVGYDEYGIKLFGGISKPTEEQKFKFCPACGRELE